MAIALFATMFAVGLMGVFKFGGSNKEDEPVKKEKKIYEDATFALGLTGATLAAVGGAMYVLGNDHEKGTLEKENAYGKRREEEMKDKSISHVDLIEHGRH